MAKNKSVISFQKNNLFKLKIKNLRLIINVLKNILEKMI